MKNVKRRIALLLCITIIATFVGCSNDSVVDTGNVSENKTGIKVDGVQISWANMSVDNAKLKLTDEQITVLKYFDTNYFYISGDLEGYSSLQRYPKAYRGAQITISGVVKKILSSSDDSYSVLFQMCNTYFDEIWLDHPILTDDEQLVVLNGKQEDARILVGDVLDVRGRYEDVMKYEFDGISYVLPTLSVFSTNASSTKFTSPAQRYTLDTITKVAKAIFGNNIKVTAPKDIGELTEKYGSRYRYLHYYVITLDDQSNANFSVFNISIEGSALTDGRYFFPDVDGMKREIRVAPDFEHFIIFVYDMGTETAYVEYYDKSFKKIWSNEYTNVESIPYDCTVNDFYLIADNDLHILNTKTGEDKTASTYVGQKIGINLMDDGAVLVSQGTKDNVMKVSKNGEILWKVNLNIDISDCSSMQLIDDNIVISVSSLSQSGNYSGGVAVISSDGEIILETYTQEHR